ncbi:MAG: L,D-transpeptidase [Paracoccus sp. (in: a-proteobacteria)]|uniref:L,D-transpeptidase family protein n=1 Tax=Paracoccus sp. TaxID=267 RepID=UPI0026E0D599|nr:L,D-transpeptidase [Paracoccus sp. (in: a-proteobacteria)]MDO5631800.1 L,D-transpeptidase [Paracoccus sp. (in: a-proteobacteria)]
MSLRLIALCSLLLSSAAVAQDVPFTAADIEAASYGGGDLPAGRSALTAKVQILLDRSGTSPGVIDGFKGGMSESAIKAFERRAGLPMDGIMDHAVWAMLQAYAERPATQDYTITQADAEGLVASIPTDYAEKAQMSHMGYTSIAERLGERFHMDEKFIAFLNPGVDLVPGATIKVMAPAPPLRGKVANIYIDKATRRVAAYDANGRMLADYPATVGSSTTPSPSGEVMVRAVALDPTYTYNPSRNFKQGNNDRVLVVPPGPNGPVGTVWIDLSKPTYGIHGTPAPSQLFRNQSYGCVRLTNWDARELAHLVQPGVTKVHFLEPGVTIAEATGVTPRAAAAAAQTPAATEATTADNKVIENTTEELADPLSSALERALPDNITVVPVPADVGGR